MRDPSLPNCSKRRCIAPLVVFLAFLVYPCGNAAAQPIFGLESEVFYDTYYRTGDYGDVFVTPGLRLAPLVAGSGNNYNFFAEMEFRTLGPDADTTEISVRTLELDIHASDHVTFKLGRFRYVPGPAELLRSTEFFSTVDFDALLRGDLDRVSRPADLVQARVFLGPLFLRLTATPVIQPVVLPAETSPWFDAMTSVSGDSFRPARIDIALGDPRYEPDVAGNPEGLDLLSAATELGATLGPVDLALYHFYGWSPSTTVVLDGTYTPATGTADVTIRPYRYRTHIVGGSLVFVSGATTFWSEALYETNKALTVDRIGYNPFTSPIRIRTGARHGSYATIAAGSRYDFSRSRTSIGLETSLGFPDATMVDGTIKDPLYRVIAGVFTHTTRDDRFSVDLIGLFAMDSPSFVSRLGAQYHVTDQVSFRARSPLFFGPRESTFGRYRDIYHLNLSVQVRL